VVKQLITSKHVKTTDLKIGQFADMNGSVIYRYQPSSIGRGSWLPGIWFIENHNHLPIYDAPTVISEDGQYTYMVVPYSNPENKHVAQAINLLKKAMRDKELDGLTYVDNYVTLKGYLKRD